MIVAVRKKMIFLFAGFLAFVFCFGFLISYSVTSDVVAPIGITVVIDAGHGGMDGGTVGAKTGITESELNLKYAKKLTEYLENFGISVVNTRTTMDGLYDQFTEDYKQVDMQKRSEIINGSNAQLLVSIHMNKFTDSSSNGAQVFFKEGSEDGENMANAVRDMLKVNFENARDLTLAGDYYILNCTNTTGIIVECGFLSNPTEEENLQNEQYMNKMCYSIYAGIIHYLKVVQY